MYSLRKFHTKFSKFNPSTPCTPKQFYSVSPPSWIIKKGKSLNTKQNVKLKTLSWFCKDTHTTFLNRQSEKIIYNFFC